MLFFVTDGSVQFIKAVTVHIQLISCTMAVHAQFIVLVQDAQEHCVFPVNYLFSGAYL